MERQTIARKKQADFDLSTVPFVSRTSLVQYMLCAMETVFKEVKLNFNGRGEDTVTGAQWSLRFKEMKNQSAIVVG